VDVQRIVMKEEAIQFGEDGSLVGIVTSDPRAKADMPAVILLNPGIVHRAGPGRIYVKIARALASSGFTVLRFDFSGIGDSSVRRDNRRFEESSVDETRTAMGFLQATRGCERFILMGGCSGAAVSLETALVDRRARGVIAINFPARADEEESADRRNDGHYYWNFALWNLKSWRKLLTGASDYRKIARALAQSINRKLSDHDQKHPSDRQFRARLRELGTRQVQLTFICSKGDVLLDVLRQAGGRDLKQLCAQGKAACEIISGSDHTFSSLSNQEALVEAVLRRANAAASVMNLQAQAPELASSTAGPLSSSDHGRLVTSE
jgi:pimeloyl-ACP methyl ester carboxylesterase